MNDLKIQALLQTLELQRNNALNGLAQVQGELAVANATIVELNKRLEAATSDKQVGDGAVFNENGKLTVVGS